MAEMVFGIDRDDDSKSSKELSETCVYTILGLDKIKDALNAGGKGDAEEGKNWRRAEFMLRNAKGKQLVPIILADAGNILELIAWGFLDNVIVPDKKLKLYHTHYFFSSLKEFDEYHDKMELKVKSTGRELPENHIKSYVICETPAFVKSAYQKLRESKNEFKI